MIQQFHDRAAQALADRGIRAEFAVTKDVEFEPSVTFVCALFKSEPRLHQLVRGAQDLLAALQRRFPSCSLRIYTDDARLLSAGPAGSLVSRAGPVSLLTELSRHKAVTLVECKLPQFRRQGAKYPVSLGAVLRLLPLFRFSEISEKVVVLDTPGDAETRARQVAKTIREVGDEFDLVLTATRTLRGVVARDAVCTRKMNPAPLLAWFEQARDQDEVEPGSDCAILRALAAASRADQGVLGLLVHPSSMLVYNEYVYTHMFKRGDVTRDFMARFYAHVLGPESSGDVDRDFAVVDMALRLRAGPDHVFNQRIFEFLSAARPAKTPKGPHAAFLGLLTRFEYAEHFYDNVQVIPADARVMASLAAKRSLATRLTRGTTSRSRRTGRRSRRRSAA